MSKTSSIDYKKRIEAYGRKQHAEAEANDGYLRMLLCPRCGEKRMNVRLGRNALSRQADVQICDECGMDEALREMPPGNTLPLEDWHIICSPSAYDGASDSADAGDGRITVLRFEPGKREGQVVQAENTLPALQALVGGYLEQVTFTQEDYVVLLCDEEGLLKDKPLCRTLLRKDFLSPLCIVGAFIICGRSVKKHGELSSLTPEQIEKYRTLFTEPIVMLDNLNG